MKRLLLTGSLILALAQAVLAQPASSFINIGTTNCPPSPVPSVDATNFANFGQMNLALNSIGGVNFGLIIFFNNALPAFDFSDVIYYTNRGVMSCDTGFLFNTQPSGTGAAHRAGT